MTTFHLRKRQLHLLRGTKPWAVDCITGSTNFPQPFIQHKELLGVKGFYSHAKAMTTTTRTAFLKHSFKSKPKATLLVTTEGSPLLHLVLRRMLSTLPLTALSASHAEWLHWFEVLFPPTHFGCHRLPVSRVLQNRLLSSSLPAHSWHQFCPLCCLLLPFNPSQTPSHTLNL